MPAISVIVPTRKRNHLLPRALKSIFAQIFSDFEIIVVDDNPPEGRVLRDPSLREVLSEPRVRVVEDASPRNAARARNCGLDRAGGDFVTFLDDDDAYRADKLEKQWRRATETNQPLVLCGLMYHLTGRDRARQVATDLFSGDEMLLDVCAGSPAFFHRRTSVRFNEDLNAYEDLYYFHSLRTAFRLDRVYNVAEPVVDVYTQPGMRVNTNGEAQMIAGQAVVRDFGRGFSPRAVEIFQMRSRVVQCKYQSGGYFKMLGMIRRLVQLNGRREIRPCLNAFLFKFPFLRRFLVT